MGEWRADHFEMIDVKDKVRPDAPKRTYLHYWVVPAKVNGTYWWSTTGGGRYELALEQHFQKLTGTLRVDGKEFKIDEGGLAGDRIALRFSASHDEPAAYRFIGRAESGFIAGTFSNLGDGSESNVRMLSSSQALVR